MKSCCVKRCALWALMLLLALCRMPVRAVAQEDLLPLDIAILEDPMDLLRLVNRDNLLDKRYPDQSEACYKLERVNLPVTRGKHLLRAVANDALEALFAAAKAEEIELYVGSAYRAYRNQEVIYYNRVKQLGYDDGYSQMAGASEHQTGLAVDVVSGDYKRVFEVEFGETREGVWLRENCARFGFILRYPQDKEDITGIRYEPWHLRYVGEEAAAYIMDNGLTLEEFSAARIRTLGAYYGDAQAMNDDAQLRWQLAAQDAQQGDS